MNNHSGQKRSADVDVFQIELCMDNPQIKFLKTNCLLQHAEGRKLGCLCNSFYVYLTV